MMNRGVGIGAASSHVPWDPQNPSAQVSLAAHVIGALHVKHPAAPIVQVTCPLPSHWVAPAVHSLLHVVEPASAPDESPDESSPDPSTCPTQPATPAATAIAANEPGQRRMRENAVLICSPKQTDDVDYVGR